MPETRETQDFDAVTLGEIVRTLRDMREELRALRSEHVRRDLYESHRAETAATIARVEDRLDRSDAERREWRRQLGLTVVGASLSLIIAVVSIITH